MRIVHDYEYDRIATSAEAFKILEGMVGQTICLGARVWTLGWEGFIWSYNLSDPSFASLFIPWNFVWEWKSKTRPEAWMLQYLTDKTAWDNMKRDLEKMI